MTTIEISRAVHLVAAAVWVGGMITLAAVIFALRRQGVSRAVLRAAARAFAYVSWTAMVVSILTGLAQIRLLHIRWDSPRLHLKLGLVATTILVALLHQVCAKRLGPASRGVVELVLLILGLAIVVAAVRL